MELGNAAISRFDLSDENRDEIAAEIERLNTVGVMGVTIRALKAQARSLEVQVERMGEMIMTPPQDALFAISNVCDDFELEQKDDDDKWEKIYGYESTSTRFNSVGTSEILGWIFPADRIEPQRTSDGAPLIYAYRPDGQWRCNVTSRSYQLNLIDIDDIDNYDNIVNEKNLQWMIEVLAQHDLA